MYVIPKVQLTSKGAALLAKVPAGEAVPVTRWQIGMFLVQTDRKSVV